ncbi:TetR/AcrR family transcriptional regulator [Corynebacterium sp. sy039]|uniref:TetR/AcrR family transcriptional regulator n=1 Tax=Corynebacterium sp. sy039 TaxID=2599641 RepID=UPI0011B3C20F|nr:TetR/AcrR family transcriptional regulator [Corynebacterium sp. sy039]QDZ42275.1 TetR/AcrR family transcriptional regulator [Corynebacterium sp. sy039]
MCSHKMTGKQRREQLIGIGRELFAERGFDGTSVEEIAARAGISKPIVYEHFGGKEGLYAVIVDRELLHLETIITESLSQGRSRERIEKAALALLSYVETDTDGFQILARDMGLHAERRYSTLLNEAVAQTSYLLAKSFERSGLNPDYAPLYSQALVGMVAMTAQWWLDERLNDDAPSKEDVAAHIVNLCWRGLSGLEAQPTLSLNELKTPQADEDGTQSVKSSS